MTERHGTVWWSELMTRDVVAARDYYAAVCGWEWATMPMSDGDYHVASRGGRMIAGMMDITAMPGMEGVPPHWFTYLAVDDVDAAVARTRALGGSVHREPWDVPGVGRIAIVADPAGASVGLMTPA
ncbi:MAG: VOC family protein [Rhodobacteraceae bacterium]|jgi:predicted enzyme related to lactoylglutathione lyase|nr:VOC family protein [Paracoccaceae bacterium]